MTNATVLPYGRKATLNRLLAEEDLELKLVSGSLARAERTMQGIHLTEILEVNRWLAEGWVMMTTGVLLQRDPKAQRKLIRDLHRMNATGLGYCVDVVTRHVPAALLDEARALGFPLFVMPLHVAARDVATRANRMILANDDTLFQQALSTQDVFFERFEVTAGTDWLPERQLVDNLSVLLGLPVSFHGNESVTPTSSDPVIEALATAPTHAPIRQRVGQSELLVVPARVGAIFVGWVVVTVPIDIDDGQVTVNTTVAVARLVALAVLSRKRPASNDRSIRQELMGQLLSVVDSNADGMNVTTRVARDGTLGALQELGFEPNKGVRVAVSATLSSAENYGVTDALQRSSVPHVYLWQDSSLLLLTQCPLDVLRRIVTEHTDAEWGFGGEVPSVVDVRRSHDQATASLQLAGRGSNQCVVFDHLPMSSWMVHRDDSPVPREKAEHEVARLRSNPAVYDTVVAYFASGLDVSSCAEKLFVHPNSVRYRLGRAEEILQVSLQNPATITDLYLALRVLKEI
ncbi:PucR family transcriptional regulator [Rhodococcoides fascians]|uniref:PucR family transcriptional regulator n=1 Tax=Rhodococcoides fascians TaxID=1828 RepID=UPI00055FBA7F|nr:PucR family transcriptional regulator [Rhodococcus fascians]